MCDKNHMGVKKRTSELLLTKGWVKVLKTSVSKILPMKGAIGNKQETKTYPSLMRKE